MILQKLTLAQIKLQRVAYKKNKKDVKDEDMS